MCVRDWERQTSSKQRLPNDSQSHDTYFITDSEDYCLSQGSKRENCPGGGGSFVFFQWYESHGGNGRGLKLAPELLCSGDREWHNKQRKKTHK